MQIRTSIAIRRVPCHNRYSSLALPTTFCTVRLRTRPSSSLEPRRLRWASLQPPTSPCSHPPPINSLGSRLDIVFRFESVQFPRCTLETFWWTAGREFIFGSFGKGSVGFSYMSLLLVIRIVIRCSRIVKLIYCSAVKFLYSEYKWCFSESTWLNFIILLEQCWKSWNC